MSGAKGRLTAAAIAIFALSACGHSGSIAPVPLDLSSFQRAQVSTTTTTSNHAGINGAVVYSLGDGGPNTALTQDLRIGADGKAYWSTTPNLTYPDLPTSGEMGSFDLSSHADSYQALSYAPGNIDETSDGSVWVTEFNNVSGDPTIDRYAGIYGGDTPISIPVGTMNNPNGFGNGIDGGIAVGSDGAVWFGSDDSGQVGEITPSTNAVSVYDLNQPNGAYEPTPQLMTLGSDGNLWVTDGVNDGVFRVDVSGSGQGSNSYFPLPQGPFGGYPYSNGELEGITEGSDKKLYTGAVVYLNAYGNFDAGKIAANPVFSSIALPVLGFRPFVLAAAPGKIFFNEIHFGGLGIYNITTKQVDVLPLFPQAYGGIAVDAKGVPWLTCTTSSGAGCIENVPLSSTWAVYPSASIDLYTVGINGEALPPGMIGIGETGNSGPFKVRTSNPSMCTANILKGFNHDIQVNPVAVGKCTVIVTDAHSRSVKVAVTVKFGSGPQEARVRGLMQPANARGAR